jgi:hypothetical protein
MMIGLSSSGSVEFEEIEMWFVDSGASRHMIGMGSMFRSFRR